MNDADIHLLQDALQRHGGLELAFVFGSVAQGMARADSDLAEATGRPVDLIDLRTVGEPLLGQILTHGRRLLGSVDAHGRLLSRHLLDASDFLPYAQRIVDERKRAWIGR